VELKHHEAVLARRDSFVIDPRLLKTDVSYNVRELSAPDTQDHIAALKESIAANGVRVPLEVRLTGTDIYIVAGHCRHAAVMALIAEGRDDIKGVPCIQDPKSINDAERTLNLVISNSGKPLSTLEVAEVVRRLEAFGWTEEQIQKRMRWKSRASVKQHAEVAALPETMKDHIRKGEISPTTARNLAKNDELTEEQKEEMIRANLEENKRLGVGKRNTRTKVTPKTLKRDKPKAKPEAPEAPAPTQVLTEPPPVSLPPAAGWDHFDHTPAREHVAISPIRPGINDLIKALEPFANLAHDHDFGLRVR
jgi:ParB-like chromosome segregation protein Spo0J